MEPGDGHCWFPALLQGQRRLPVLPSALSPEDRRRGFSKGCSIQLPFNSDLFGIPF